MALLRSYPDEILPVLRAAAELNRNKRKRTSALARIDAEIRRRRAPRLSVD